MPTDSTAANVPLGVDQSNRWKIDRPGWLISSHLLSRAGKRVPPVLLGHGVAVLLEQGSEVSADRHLTAVDFRSPHLTLSGYQSRL